MDYAKEYDRMVEQSNQQQERIKELTVALTASQAREQMLRDALGSCLGEGDSARFLITKIKHALSLTSDDTALREYGAKLLEEMAVELGVCEHKCDVEVRNKAAELRSGD